MLRPNPVTPHIGSVEEAGGSFAYAEAEPAIAQGFAEAFGIRLVEGEPAFDELALEEEFRSCESSI